MSHPSSPTSPTKPKRRNSLKEQWDTTTKVVNVKQKIHSNLAERYTELQKSTFTRWVNIQLRMIDISQLNHSSSPSKKFPEIQAIDKDFRDGKKLIQLLGVLYPNDSELPKLERGRTRHHHIANINKVLEFLQKRLDEKGLIALKAIGPVDIVDGNVKLTLGLIWLMISKFLQMFSVPFEVTEEELEQVEQRIKENLRNKKVNHHHHHHHHDLQRFLLDHDDDEEIETFEEFQQQFRSHFVSIEELFNESGEGPGVPDTIYEEKEIDYDTQKSVNEDDAQDPLMMTDSSQGEPSPSPLLPEIEVPNDSSPSPLPPEIKVPNDSTPSPSPSIMEIPNRRLRDLSKSEKRLSLPIFRSTLTEDNDSNARSDKKLNPTSKQFRTLRLSSSPINSNSSNVLFWINMQLIDYASILPPSKYPLEDFIGLNDGFVLSALIQYLNIEWRMDDLDLLNPDDIKMETDNPENLSEEEFHEREIYKEIKAKERLSKCFEIFERKLNVKRPKALISMLIEKDYSDKERLKRTGLAWSVYISEIFLIVSKSKKRRSRLLASNNIEENKVEEKEKEKEKPKEHIIKFLDYDAIYYQSPSNNNQRKQKKSRGCLPFFSSSHDDDPTTLPPWTPPAISLIAMIWEWTLSWLLNDEDDDDEMDFFLGV